MSVGICVLASCYSSGKPSGLLFGMMSKTLFITISLKLVMESSPLPLLLSPSRVTCFSIGGSVSFMYLLESSMANTRGCSLDRFCYYRWCISWVSVNYLVNLRLGVVLSLPQKNCELCKNTSHFSLVHLPKN